MILINNQEDALEYWGQVGAMLGKQEETNMRKNLKNCADIWVLQENLKIIERGWTIHEFRKEELAMVWEVEWWKCRWNRYVDAPPIIPR